MHLCSQCNRRTINSSMMMIIIIIIILKLKTMLTRTVRETHLVSGVRQWRQGWFSGVARIWYEGHKTS